MIDVLIIEDNKNFSLALKDYLNAKGFSSEFVLSGKEGLDFAKKYYPKIIFVDIFLPDLNGIELISKLNFLGAKVFVITAANDISLAVDAMKKGAYDFIVKPVDFELVYLKIKNIFDIFTFSNIDFIANSIQMKKVLNEAMIAAKGNTSILLIGETGVGKEKLAELIYSFSGRTGKFVGVNSSAIPENLFESEIFGYKKGSFTGATFDKKGLLEEASNGVFFLDEITEMPPIFQSKLLRVLENRKFRPVGSSKEHHIDFKLISATNLPLSKVKQRLRNDLFYRVATFIIEIPPLRERKEDIIPLARKFIYEYGKEKGIYTLSEKTEKLLLSYSWPGNIRELRNEIERACLICSGKILEPEHFSKGVFSHSHILTLSQMEKDYIRKILRVCNGNKTKAAKLLGISRVTLRKKLNEK